MQIAIISLQDNGLETRTAGRTPDQASDQDNLARLYDRLALQACEERQSLALMVAMRDGGQLAPLLVCLKDSRLHQKARQLDLPVLAISGPDSLFTLFRLWRWQRSQPRLLIQTVGRQAIRLGQRLRSMRKPGSSLFAHAFFLAAPDMTDKANRMAVLAADRIFCGTNHIRARLLAGAGLNSYQNDSQSDNQATEESLSTEGLSTDSSPKNQHPASLANRLELLAPGADFAGLAAKAKSGQWQSGRHFVFGMDNSLVPRSGALVVVRAMAAIWQFDELPAWEVRMFGLGPRYHEILDEAVRLGVQSRLCLLAEQSPEEMTCHCHAWLAPGSSTRELPESLWLGPAAGLPLIASNSDLHQERLLLHSKNDTNQLVDQIQLFAANDPQELARAMRAVLQDATSGKLTPSPVLARLIGKAGPERMAEQAIATYEQLLAEHKLLNA